MHHLHIDSFAAQSGPVHSMDARMKLAAALCFILIVVLTPDGSFLSFGGYFFLIALVILASRVPLFYVVKRSLVLLPFALAVSIFVPFITSGTTVFEFHAGPFHAAVTAEGIVKFASIGLRATIAFLTTITLVATTRFGDLMRASGSFGLPSKLVVVLTFMYRYLFILIDEAGHMILARNLRAYGKSGAAMVAASGGIVGALLVRSFEHADRLYSAMMLRGYTGRPVTLTPMRIRAHDIVYAVLFLGAAVLALLVGKV